MKITNVYVLIKALQLFIALAFISIVYGAILYPVLPLPYTTIVIDGLISVIQYTVLLYICIKSRMLVYSKDKSINYEYKMLLFKGFIFSLLALGLYAITTFVTFSLHTFQTLSTTLPIKFVSGFLVFAAAYIIIKNRYLLSDNQEVNDVDAEQETIADELQHEQEAPETIERITVKNGSKISLIPAESIQYIQADGDYITLYTHEGKFLKDFTMKYLESHLCNKTFVRIHRSYIVNIHEISSIQLYEKQNYRVYLKNGTFLRASVGGYKNLKHRLNM